MLSLSAVDIGGGMSDTWLSIKHKIFLKLLIPEAIIEKRMQKCFIFYVCNVLFQENSEVIYETISVRMI